MNSSPVKKTKHTHTSNFFCSILQHLQHAIGSMEPTCCS